MDGRCVKSGFVNDDSHLSFGYQCSMSQDIGPDEDVRVITGTRSGEESSVKSQDDGFSHYGLLVGVARPVEKCLFLIFFLTANLFEKSSRSTVSSSMSPACAWSQRSSLTIRLRA